MQINVAGLHMEVGEALEAHCQQRLDDLKKYFDKVVDADVTFRNESHRHIAEVTMHASGITLHAEGEGSDFYPAVDDAAQKLQRQLERYKGRMQKHRNRREKITDLPMAFSAVETQVEEKDLDDAPDDFFAEFTPKIKHKDVKDIQMLTVDEAVMQMDLMHRNFYIFQNPKSGDLNVVYRHKEGDDVRWIEPKTS